MRKADSSPSESTLQPRQCSRHSVSMDMSSTCRVADMSSSCTPLQCCRKQSKAEDRSAAYICSNFRASVVTSVVHRMSHHGAELADRSLAQSRPASGSVPKPLRGSLHRRQRLEYCQRLCQWSSAPSARQRTFRSFASCDARCRRKIIDQWRRRNAQQERSKKLVIRLGVAQARSQRGSSCLLSPSRHCQWKTSYNTNCSYCSAIFRWHGQAIWPLGCDRICR